MYIKMCGDAHFSEFFNWRICVPLENRQKFPFDLSLALSLTLTYVKCAIKYR